MKAVTACGQSAAAVLVLLLLLATPSSVFAWAAIGHRMTAETAALLLRERDPRGFGDFLARHRFELGMYAVYPDMRFRQEDGKSGESEAPLHFFALDAAKAILPQSAWAKPYASIQGELQKSEIELGRGPWRAAQLFALAKARLGEVQEVRGTYQRGAAADAQTRAVFDALYYLGVFAHYAADAAVPHHASADANSVAKGQNGLHFYFEGDCVEVLEPPLSERVLSRARKESAARIAALGGDDASVEQLMIALTADSLGKLAALEAVDAKRVVHSLAAPGAFAKRSAPPLGCQALSPMVEERLVAAIVVIAHLWRRATPSTIDWSQSRSLQFNDLSNRGFIPFP